MLNTNSQKLKNKLRIAILAENTDGFVKPMAQGLKRMFQKTDNNARVFVDAHKNLYLYNVGFKDNIKSFFLNIFRNFRSIIFLFRLIFFDVFILVASVPGAYLKTNTPLLEKIRKFFPKKIIVLYDVLYLPTTTTNNGTLWYSKLADNFSNDSRIETKKNYGMERFDYYLIASVVTEYPLQKLEHPLSIIGINFEDETLFAPSKNSVIALVDFERKDTNPVEREIVIQALKETETEYIELKSFLPSKKIREIYRKCALFFPAHRESFGLPICELQLCGAAVFVPYKYWVPAYHIKDDLFSSEKGRLSSNFIVYNNNLEELKQKILAFKQNYKPEKIVETFRNDYPAFYEGNITELQKFIDLCKTKTITGQTHKNYITINNAIDYKQKINIAKYYD